MTRLTPQNLLLKVGLRTGAFLSSSALATPASRIHGNKGGT